MKLIKEFEIATGHRLPNHKAGCFNLHGHNYWVYIDIEFDDMQGYYGGDGFKIDFGMIKKVVNDQFDHKFILFKDDPLVEVMKDLPGVVLVDYIPTAENMSLHIKRMLEDKLKGSGVIKISIGLNETKFSKAIQ